MHVCPPVAVKDKLKKLKLSRGRRGYKTVVSSFSTPLLQAFIALPLKNGCITRNGLTFLITRMSWFIQLVRSASKWGNKSNPLIFVIWELDQKARSKNKHRANGMKNDSLGTGAYIPLGEERDSETWLNCAAEQTLHISYAFLSTAVGCPCGCRRSFCRKEGEGRWNQFHPCLPCFELPCHLPRMELACSICLIPDPFGCQRFESLIDGVELEIYRPWESTSGRMVLTLGSRTRKCAGWKKTTPSPTPTCQTLLLSHNILIDITTAPPDPAGILIGGRAGWAPLLFHMKGFSLGQHSFLVGRVYSPSFLNFLSLMLPSCVTGLSADKFHWSSRELQCQERAAPLPMAGGASRKADSCIKISARFVRQFLLINSTTELRAVWY